MSSLLPTPEPPDPVEGQMGHFDHTNWVKASLKALDVGLLRNTGDMLKGSLTIDEAGPEANIYLKGSAIRAIYGVADTGGARWRLALGDGTAEGGADSGSRFHLNAYADTGSIKHTVLEADRASGLVTVAGNPTAARGIATKDYVDTTAVPLGSIIAYGGSAAPAGWHICNGTAHGSAALETLLGSPNTPDLSSRFIIGASSTLPPKAVGGAASVQLTAAESGLPAHVHGASSGATSINHAHSAWTDAQGTHSHGGATGWMDRNVSHQHMVNINEGSAESGSDGNMIDTVPTWQGNYKEAGHTTVVDTNHLHGIAADGNHAHNVGIGAADVVHSHAVSVAANAAANAAAAHNNMPPYFALVYIIKKV